MKIALLYPLLTTLILIPPAARAGKATSGKAPPPLPAPPANPLSFFGGRLVLDFEERVWFESGTTISISTTASVP